MAPTQKARGHCHFQCRVLFVSFLRAEPVESGSLLLGYFTSPLHSRPVCVFVRTLLSAVIKNLTPIKARCLESATKNSCVISRPGGAEVARFPLCTRELFSSAAQGDNPQMKRSERAAAVKEMISTSVRHVIIG